MRFSDALTARLKQSPGKPLITYYNETTGERSELSTTTYANWVAKTANVLCDELDIMPGDRVGVTLGVHWLTPVFMGAAWLCGAQVVSKQVEPELVVGGPELAEQPHALACSLHPFALAFPAPTKAHDFGLLWPSQPDLFLGNPYDATDIQAKTPVTDRVITDLDPSLRHELFLDPFMGGGSIVLIRDPDESKWPERMASEHATTSVRR
ncbi:MAG: hypothetical protein KDB38_12580 [Nocardioidaceae bacterium]|nr:hypothetical protein [Nocardioidaceae bacterium]MCB8993304.1 hypothetical protein [Nocardioidaceae bacterium]MCO5323820.1 TIGR03089 family protein [Nocardioidaceae bacterium]